MQLPIELGHNWIRPNPLMCSLSLPPLSLFLSLALASFLNFFGNRLSFLFGSPHALLICLQHFLLLLLFTVAVVVAQQICQAPLVVVGLSLAGCRGSVRYTVRCGSVRGIIADYLSLRWQLNTSNKLPHLGLFFHSFIRFFGFSFRTFLIAFTFTLVSTNLPLPSPSSTHLLGLFVFAFVSIWIRDICSFVVGFVWLDGAISLALPSLWQLLSFALSLTLSFSRSRSLLSAQR